MILALCRLFCRLVVAQEQTTSREILLWMTPSEAPKALQASECSELLDPTRANCWISAHHQPGKFKSLLEILRRQVLQTFELALLVHCPATKAPPRQHSQNYRISTTPRRSWAEAHIKIARMTLTIKLDRNWSSFQLANSAPPLSVTDSWCKRSLSVNMLQIAKNTINASCKNFVGAKAPQKLMQSHWCIPFTATFSKRQTIGVLWSERCDRSGASCLHIHVHASKDRRV